MVQFVPLNVPFERRCQTLMILLCFSLLFVVVSLLMFCLFHVYTWPFLTTYVAWISLDDAPERGGRRFEWVRRLFVWNLARDYFPCRLIKEADLDPEKRYVFGYHPHGILSTGLWLNFATETNGFGALFPGLRVHTLTLAFNLKIPIWREILLSHGMCSVSRQSCDHLLDLGPGNCLMLVPGGAREALDTRPGTNDLTLNSRKGFIKVALSHGADLVPVFTFGENDIFNQVENKPGTLVRLFQNAFLDMFGFAPVMPYGRGIFTYDMGLLPRRHPLVTLVGSPISVSKVPRELQTDAVINALHKKYVNALQDLYDKHKDTYAPDRVKDLEIIR